MVMEKNEMPEMTPLPKVLKVLEEGCNLAANKVQLMLIPFLVDLLLLLGPKLRIAEYFGPAVEAAYSQMTASVSSRAVSQLQISFELLKEMLSSVNLLGFIQTFPIGISVLNASGGAETPLGASPSVELTSILQMIPVIAFMSVLGVLIGAFYFSFTAREVSGDKGKYSFAVFGKQLLNTVLLYIAMIILILMLAVPCSCLMTFAFMAVPILYQVFMIILIVLTCWLLIPLYYIPHGIFFSKLSFPEAVTRSFKMASWSSTLTVRFILFSIILSLGLNMIWAIPEQSSWMILISIFGHAYISTALLAGSFILYRELDRWQKENRAFLEWRKANLRFKQIFKKEPVNYD